MTRTLEQETAEIGVRLLDDAHIIWLAAQSECANALRDWFGATPRDCDATYFRYRAALDREEAAARDLERLCELSEPCCRLLTDERPEQATPPPEVAGYTSPPIETIGRGRAV
ncbi:MAG: hypothetical protein ACLPY3_04285 [Solirubrobacteraceae bacterium]